MAALLTAPPCNLEVAYAAPIRDSSSRTILLSPDASEAFAQPRLALCSRDTYTHAMTRTELEAAALQLPAEERTRLASRLLASLEDLSEAEHDETWATEALRRDRELDEQPDLGRETSAVFASARQRLER